MRHLFEIPDATFFLLKGLWTRPFFIEQTIYPSYDINHPLYHIEQQLQTSFLDYVWEITLSNKYFMLDENKIKNLNPKDYEKSLTITLIRERENNKNNYKTFHELLEQELYGSFSSLTDIVNDMLEKYYSTYKLGSSRTADGFYPINGKKRAYYFMDFVIKSIINLNMYWLLPSVSISAALHTLKRWEIKSMYKESDSFDIMHAQIALPYCNYFLTERNLCGLIHDTHIKLIEKFNCNCISNPKNAYENLLGSIDKI
jgi:hypothetical protein